MTHVQIPPLRPYTSRSLGIIVCSYNTAVTYRVNALRGHSKPPLWQRNYYDHVNRNDKEYEDVWNYIEANPSNWLDGQVDQLPPFLSIHNDHPGKEIKA